MLRRGIAYSFVVELATTVSMVGCFKIAADSWGTGGFGEWIVTRRVLALLVPLVVCGLDIAIPRYVAIAKRDHNGDELHFIWGATWFVSVTLFASSIFLWVFREHASRAVFGDGGHSDLISPLILMMVASGLYVPCYAFLRGTMRIMEANLIHVLMYGLIPPVALIFLPNSPREAMLGVGVLSLILALICVLYVTRYSRWQVRKAISSARVLAAYGVTRMYAAFFLIALVSLPTIVVGRYAGVEQAGFVAFGLTLVGMAGTAASPIGVTMLPLATRLLAEGRHSELRVPVLRLEKLIVLMAVIGTGFMWVCAPWISTVFFGEQSPEATQALRISAVGAGPYVYFTCMRNIIDAQTERGVNTRNVIQAFVAFLFFVGMGLILPMDDIGRIVTCAYVLALVLLALLTRRALRNIFQQRT